MSDRYDPLEEAFNDALEESGALLGYEPEGFGPEGFGPGDSFGLYENEGEAFSFGKAFKSLGRVVSRLPLKQLAPIAGRVAGGLVGGPIGAQLGGMAAGMLGEEEYELEGEGFEPELEFEQEYESGLLQEDEAEAFGLDSFTDSLAESLATQAAASESEAESSALLGGITIHIISGAPISVRRASSTLVKCTNRLGRYLRRRPRTRNLMKTIPTIQRNAVRMLTKHAQKGGKVTPALVGKAMAKATVKTLGTPQAAAKGLANNAVKSRRASAPSARTGSGYKRSIARVER
ncbi:MAG TPA: hypothetical protein VK614_06355 [Allosphingosinicella sp.]|nr:hypothetical protein [Allosphingosinicella sp.]